MYKLMISLLLAGLASYGMAQPGSTSLADLIQQRGGESKLSSEEEDKLDKWCKKVCDVSEFMLSIRRSSIGGDSESFDGSVLGIGVAFNLRLLNLPNGTEFHGGLAYSMQGGGYRNDQYEPGGNMRSSQANIRLNYLQLPLSARYPFQRSFFAEAGLQPGFLLSAKDRHDGQKEPIREIYQPFDLGLMLGVGYHAPQRWGVGLQYNMGLSNINRQSGPYAQAKDYNRGLAMWAGYRL